MVIRAILVFLITLIVSIFTLYLPAKNFKKFLKNPGFLIGDFILIPLFFMVNFIFLKDFSMSENWIFLLIIAVTVVLFFGKKFDLQKFIWIPHGVFAVVIVFLAELDIITLNLLPLLLLFAHQILGTIYPKKI